MLNLLRSLSLFKEGTKEGASIYASAPFFLTSKNKKGIQLAPEPLRCCRVAAANPYSAIRLSTACKIPPLR